MKISEMTNDQATEALVRLSGPISAICDDEEMMALMEELQSMRNATGQPVIKAVGKMIPRFVTFGLIKHKRDLYEIVGALLCEKTSAVGGMNLVETINAVKNSYDEILASFFTRSKGATTNSEGSLPVA